MIGAAGAPSAASAAARPPSAGGADGPVDLAAAAAAAAASGPTKFGEGETVILFNGSLCYEAEVLQVQSGDGAAGGKKGGSKKGGLSYLIRYTKWPRRPEEWVGDAFVYPWSDAMAKGATNRPPRKAMWVEQKAAATVAGASAPMDDDAADADADAGGGRRAGRAAKAAAAEDESAAKAGSKRPRKASDKGDEKGARGRSTTPLSDQDDGSAAAANAMALMEDSDAGALMDLMKGGGPSDGRGEDDDGEEDEEEDEEEGEEEDDDEDDDEDSNGEEEEEEEENDKEENDDEENDDEEDADDAADDLKLILAQQKHKDKKDLQAQGGQHEDSPGMLKSPRADKKPVDLKHRRKGVPLRSLRPLMLLGTAGSVEAKDKSGEGDDAAGDDATGDLSKSKASAPAPAEESGVLTRAPAGIRRRKPKCPTKSLHEM